MVKGKKQEIVVTVQNTYYKTNKPFGNLTEEELFKLDPVAETKMYAKIEKNDNFDSVIENALTIDNCISNSVEEECNVLYTVMSYDDEIVYRSIQKINLFNGN